MLVSGIAFGPNFASQRRASSLVRPFCGPGPPTLFGSTGETVTAGGRIAIVEDGIR
jgi:hypothetical protein